MDVRAAGRLPRERENEDCRRAATSAAATLADAAAIGGWTLVAAPSAPEALGRALARKWPFAKADEGGPARTAP